MWNEAKLQSLIDDKVEENLNLEYKAEGALDRSDSKKGIEITKDVSAMANADGGTIIYGIAESPDQPRLPEKFSPIDRKAVSKEWLEHIIGNVRPRIDGLRIHLIPVGDGENGVVYVVDVPASTTVHQAQDKKYYKRLNFESVPMEDYEIRLTMNRHSEPDLRITRSQFKLNVNETVINGASSRVVQITPRIWMENFSFIKPASVVTTFVSWGLSSKSVSNAIHQHFDIQQLNLGLPLESILNIANNTKESSGEGYFNFTTNVITCSDLEIPMRIGQDWFNAEIKIGLCVAAENMRPKFYQYRILANPKLVEAANKNRQLEVDNELIYFDEMGNSKPLVSYTRLPLEA